MVPDYTAVTFRASVEQYLAARQEHETTPAGSLRAASAEAGLAEASAFLEAAGRAHANATGHVDPVPGEAGTFTPAPLVTEYERLRDDPAASRAEVHAAAQALALARMAHRVRAGLPVVSGAG